MNENLKQFVELNKDKVTVKLDSNGNVIGIESIVKSEDLNFFRTNCKIEKNGQGYILETIDGQKYNFTFKTEELSRLRSFGSRVRKIVSNRKLLPTKIKAGYKEAISHVPIIGKKKVEVKESLHSKVVNPLGNYAQIKGDTLKLIVKLDAIFKKYSSEDKYRLDAEIQNLKQRFEGLKKRYASAETMNDTSEMLNVKVKLVGLSGRIIAREKSLNEDKKEQPKVIPKEPEQPKEQPKEPEQPKEKPIEPKINSNEKVVYQDEHTVITKPIKTNNFEIKDNDIEVFDMKDVLVDGTVTMDPITGAKKEAVTIKPVEVDMKDVIVDSNQTVNYQEPKVEEIKESVDDLSRKKAILEGIEKSNKKVKEIEENITYLEKRIEETDGYIKNGNLDSLEISKFERVKKDYQEKLDNQRKLLEQAKEELKQNVSKLTKFMNEKVTFYVDGKPYKEVTRNELESYKKMHASDEKRKEDFKKQTELLERRKELERQLKENYEELKSLSTFSDDMLYPKEEPSIEEIQETIRRFHQ